jgi:serine/threonine protein phosphatase 1
MKKFVIGDIHGRIEALKQVLKLSNFDYENDKLIILGDVVDGGYNTYEVIEELLKIKNRIFVIGNHDCWVKDYFYFGYQPEVWTSQGGQNTINSYLKRMEIKQSHKDFFNTGYYWYCEDNMLFVHGGFDPMLGVEKTDFGIIIWDRDLIKYAQKHKIYKWKYVFVGHTTTQMFDNKIEPIWLNNLCMMDTGAGWNGKLTIMDIDTKDYWQSDIQKPAI